MATMIRIEPEVRDSLERYKLRLAGAIVQPMTQSQVVAVLLELGDRCFAEAVKIAGESK
jgi:hypothetical protein